MTLLAVIEVFAYVVVLIAALSSPAHARHGWWVEEHAKELNFVEHYGYRESMRVVQNFWDGASKKIDNSSAYNKAYTGELFYLISNYIPTDPKEYQYRLLLASDLIDAGAREVVEIENDSSGFVTNVSRSVSYDKLPSFLVTRVATPYGRSGLVAGFYSRKTGTIRLGYGYDTKKASEQVGALTRTLELKRNQSVNSVTTNRTGETSRINKGGLAIYRDLNSINNLSNGRANSQYVLTIIKSNSKSDSNIVHDLGLY